MTPFIVGAQNEKEKEAIKSVIIRETSSFMNLDRKAWSDSWNHQPYAYWSFSDSTGASYIEGWDAINKTFDSYFNSQIPSKARITEAWQEIRIYGNGAFARYIQKSADGIDTEVTSQVRVLEKVQGKWKVVYVGVVDANLRKPIK